MVRIKRRVALVLLSVLTALLMCLGVAFTMPTKTVKAETLPSTGWTFAREGDVSFRIQDGNTYWTTYTNNVTTASMLDYTELNGKTLSQINAEKPGAVSVTLQPAGGTIGSFYRVNINTSVAGFTALDVGTLVIKAGWSHTDANATYTINSNLYFAHKQSTSAQNDTVKLIPEEKVVDISDKIAVLDQGIQATNTRSIFFNMSDTTDYWNAMTPNEHGGSFLNTLYINGTSIKEWNNKAHAALEAGEIDDITYGSGHGTISGLKDVYAPIFVWNSDYTADNHSYAQVWIPTGYISNVSSFKVAKGYAHLQDDGTLYYVAKDVEYVKSGSSFVKVASAVDISDSFKILAQDYTASDGTMLYYLHTNNTKYWTQQYGSTGGFAINEKEWKGVGDVSLQGGAVQMSYLEFNGTPIYDINASDNGNYGATQGNIASGGKYAPILAFLTPEELGNAIKLQVPSAYPSGSGTAAANHKSITIKKGFYVVDTSTNIKYEVTKDIQWDYEDGTWGEHVEKIETNVTDAKLFGSSADAFAGIALAGSDFNKAPSTYAGGVATALSFAQSANFLSHVLIDDAPLNRPSEAFLNVWGNMGYFTFRPGNNNATKITILAGCQIPTYNALSTGAKEVYVTTKDVTFIKGADGNWAQKPDKLEAGEYETTITKLQYGKGPSSWMMFSLADKDYPKIDGNDSTTYNIAADEEKVAALNLYDKVVVDGYTIRSLLTKNVMSEPPKMNLYVESCFAFRIPGKADGLTTAQKVTIKAGAQFPSYVYITEGIEAYYVIPEDVTFVNVEDASGAWAQQYKVTYMASGEVVAESTYLPSQGETPSVPEVPEKAGYSGEWESYTVGSAANITVKAVYTKRPTSLGTTSIATLRNIDKNNAIFVIEPTNSDYPASVEGSWNLGLDVSHLQKFNLLDYITINGKTLREIGVTEMAINKFTRSGLGLNTTLSASMTVVIKEGCEIPSYAFWQNPNGEASCYTVDATYTAVYAAAGETAFDISSDNVGVSMPQELMTNDVVHYTLSDLNRVGYDKTDYFRDGYEELQNTEGLGSDDEAIAKAEARYRYGYVNPTGFILSFDFKFSDAAFYNALKINLGTEGHGGNKFHFGWRFYLLRKDGDTSNIHASQCVEYFSNTSTYGGNIPGSADKILANTAFVAGTTYHVTIGYKLLNATTGEVLIYTAIDGKSRVDTYVLGGDFVKFAPYASSLTMNASITEGQTITVSDPDMYTGSIPYKLTLDGIGELYANRINLPTVDPVECNMEGCVFIGWTKNSDLANLTKSTLYPAGYKIAIKADTVLYPVWLDFSMQSGAAVRTTEGSSGLRYTVEVDGALYKAWVENGIITEIGSILAPTDYLKEVELTHALGSGKYVSSVTSKWQRENEVYTSAFTNFSYEQYGRQFSARGYVQIQYTNGKQYIYTTYSEADHSRSIYDVATMAFQDKYSDNKIVKSYVNDVADIVIDGGLTASKNPNAVGAYNVGASLAGNTLTVTISNGQAKAALVNGTRIVMGKQANVMIGGVAYVISGYKLNNDGLQLSFTLEQNNDVGKEYYIELLQKYLDSEVYTKTHKAYVDQVVNTAIATITSSDSNADWANAYAEAERTLKRVKTAKELASNNTSKDTLSAPALSKGLGYTVTWSAVADADYYTVSDNNDYRKEVIVLANEPLTYKAEVVGDHNIKVTAHSYFDTFNSSSASNQVATPKVKPVFSYKSMQDGLYKFTKSQMGTMGLSTDGGWYVDKKGTNTTSDDEYFAYYNKDTGWSPYPSMATDWTSPAEFPAHAQRLKDMGNNIILIARDTNAEFKAGQAWESSRTKYVMDTAWSMGMKVLVCDEVFYKLSMSDNSGTGATSKSQVTTAINNRAGFAEYVTHPAFYGFSLDDEPYGKWISALSYTISALDEACANLGVEDPFYLACLFQAQGGELGKELYLTQSSLESYYNKWLAIEGVDNKYLYVDIYTQHAMDQPTNRYNTSFEVVYSDSYLGGKYEFYQAITAHTQNNGVLTEQDMYMSLLYAAAHDVAGYSWFCYFPIAGELAGTLGGYDGNGYGNGIGNEVEEGKSFYNAAKTAGYQFELIQGLLDGYDWKTRSHDDSKNLLTTTLSNGTNTATMYVNADVDNMSGSVTVTASGSQCYLVGYGVGTAEAPYQAVSGSVTLAPGQAVICIN